MNIDESRQYLIQSFGPEFTNYITNTLAGDFATAVAQILIGRSEKKQSKFDLSNIIYPDSINREKWSEWIAAKKSNGKKVTAIAAKKQLLFLASYSLEVQSAIIDCSIMNGYTGLFPPKGYSNGQIGNGSGVNQKPDNSAVGRVRANATRERAKLASARSGLDNPIVGANDRDVWTQVDEPIRG